MNIFENPFYILGVSPRDNRRAIAAAAEDKLFLSDAAVINDARNALLIPEKRLAAEMRWFPGIDDRKIAELIEFLLQLRAGKDQNSNLADLTDYIDIDALNLLIYIWEFKSASDITAVIFEISKFFEDIYVDDILVTINEARAEAGFPEAGEAEVEYELNNYRADIVKTIEDKLSALALEEYYDVINSLAEKYAEGDGNDTIYYFDEDDALKISGSYKISTNDTDVKINVGNGSMLLVGAAGKNIKVNGKTITNSDADDNTLPAEMITLPTVPTMPSILKSPFVYGTDGNDNINNLKSRVLIYSGLGNDSIYNEYGYYVTINSGAGDDSIYNYRNNDVSISGADGNDYIFNQGYTGFYEGQYVTISGDGGNDSI